MTRVSFPEYEYKTYGNVIVYTVTPAGQKLAAKGILTTEMKQGIHYIVERIIPYESVEKRNIEKEKKHYIKVGKYWKGTEITINRKKALERKKLEGIINYLKK